MAKRKSRRRRSTSEKVMIILGILIALSMMLSLFVGLGRGGSSGNAPLPPEIQREIDPDGLIGAIEAGPGSQMTTATHDALAPPRL